MSKRNTRIDISSLVNKYKTNEEVVSKIEKSLTDLPLLNVDTSDVNLSKLYDSKLLSEVKNNLNKEKISSVEPFIAFKENGKYILINNLYRFAFLTEGSTIQIYAISLTEEEKIKFIYYYLQKGKYNILFLTHFFSKLNEEGYNDYKIANLLNTSISQIRNIKRLEQLDNTVLKALKEDKITYTIARNLINFDKKSQKELLNKILAGNLSNRDVESMRREIKGSSKNIKVELINNKITLVFENDEEAKKNYQKLLKEYH
mgnify:FL=1